VDSSLKIGKPNPTEMVAEAKKGSATGKKGIKFQRNPWEHFE
jgi:hypothetical protein